MRRAFSVAVCAASLLWSGASVRADTAEVNEGGAAASRPSAEALPSLEMLAHEGARIGSIHFERRDIFDPRSPGEDRWLYRMANRLHRRTSRSAIAERLLFRSGDRLDPDVLKESERRLRESGFLLDVDIVPVAWDGDQVDLEVRTRDLWTMDLGVNFGRSGGANHNSFKFRDANLLGSGRYLSLERSSDVDRTTSTVRIFDPALGGGRAELDLLYANSDDGGERGLRVGRPFFSLGTHWALELDASEVDRVDSIYTLGHVSDRFRARVDAYELAFGRSKGVHDGRLVRWTTGVRYEDRRFDAVDRSTGLPPESRTLVSPWVGVEWRGERWEERNNLDQIGRVEDLALGNRVSARVGWAGEALGSTENAALFRVDARSAFEAHGLGLVHLGGHLSGRWNARPEDLIAGISAQLHRPDFERHQLFASIDLDLVRRLDRESQLLLGGDSGLRGYPLRFQDGDRRLLVTLEQRWFTSWFPWKLVHVGAAAFVDAGRTWGGPEATQLGWLGDVGFGLRLGNSRSGHGAVIHLDVAVPLVRPSGVAGVQYLISTSQSF